MYLSKATFGSGCFWCTEAVFKELKGVVSAAPGYAGGHTPHPTYEQVCSGTTGHAEVARIEFDPAVIPFEQLVEIFFATHDPTTPNRQGPDVGEQYRSVIFYHNDEQRAASEKIKTKLEQDQVFSRPIVTSIEPLTSFYPAEDYHRDYYANHSDQPYCQAVISPKISKLRKKYLSILNNDRPTTIN